MNILTFRNFGRGAANVVSLIFIESVLGLKLSKFFRSVESTHSRHNELDKNDVEQLAVFECRFKDINRLFRTVSDLVRHF